MQLGARHLGQPPGLRRLARLQQAVTRLDQVAQAGRLALSDQRVAVSRFAVSRGADQQPPGVRAESFSKPGGLRIAGPRVVVLRGPGVIGQRSTVSGHADAIRKLRPITGR
jgi:hypothetical protein